MRVLLRNPAFNRFGIAILAGFLLAVAFPNWNMAGAAWLGPGLLLFATAGAPAGLAFRIAFAGGMVYYLTALYWLLLIPVKVVPIAGWIGLAAYLSVYLAFWVWLCWRLFPGEIPRAAASPFDSQVTSGVLAPGWGRRAFWCLECGVLWVALEMIVGRFLTGFPWLFLGSSQYQILPLIQISSITGVYGVSFLVAWFSVGLLCAGFAMGRNPATRAGWAREIALPLLVVAVVATHGVRRMGAHREAGFSTRVALIQPSIPQTLIWDPAENETRFQQLVELSLQALEHKPDLLIWPEASVPNMLRYDEETGEAIRKLAVDRNVWAILGSDDAELRPGGSRVEDLNYYNSAFAISPEGRLAGIYRKRRLVIFGEYVPFARHLPFLRLLSPAGEGGFTPGTKPVPFHLDSLDVTTSVLICFEDVFPHLAREYVDEKTDFLVNLTNNGWFGESAAQWQHAAAAVFRAVENRIPLVRCANNGLTCWVDAIGRMHEVYFPGSDDVYQAGYKLASIPTLAPDGRRELTFYTRHGDVFGWACVGIALAHPLARRFLRAR